VSKILDAAVTESEGGWDFQCPGVQGDGCHSAEGVPFSSTGWPTKKAALARGAQHFAAHKDKTPMQELDAFRREQGLVVNDDGTVSVEDI
jgi:hypothetical protein